MIKYFFKRLFQSALVMLVVAFVSFSLFNFVGDPINNMVGEGWLEREEADKYLKKVPEIRPRLSTGQLAGNKGHLIEAVKIQEDYAEALSVLAYINSRRDQSNPRIQNRTKGYYEKIKVLEKVLTQVTERCKKIFELFGVDRLPGRDRRTSRQRP